MYQHKETDKETEKKEFFASVIEQMLSCPITYSMMKDPVLAVDGHTYERSAIEAWIKEHGTSPMTRKDLTDTVLFPNRVLQEIIPKIKPFVHENQTLKQTIEKQNRELKKQAAKLEELLQYQLEQLEAFQQHQNNNANEYPHHSLFHTPQVKPQPQVDPELLKQFINKAIEADFNAVGKMLKMSHKLGYTYTTITDLSGRTFPHITVFQYAVWALDWRTWKEIGACFNDDDELRRQAQVFIDFDQGKKTIWQIYHGKHFDLQPLIEALSDYINKWDDCYARYMKGLDKTDDITIGKLIVMEWNKYDKSQWCKVVGGEQRKLPSHVAIEYCRKDHTFEHHKFAADRIIPGYVDQDKQKLGIRWWFNGKKYGGLLGDKFAVDRGNYTLAFARSGHIIDGGYRENVRDDLKALKSFLALRTQQVKQLLVDSLKLSCDASAAIHCGKK